MSEHNSLSRYESLFTENIDINKCHDEKNIIKQYINILYNNMTLLMYICINSSQINQFIEIINFLILECNAEIDLPNKTGWTALMLAVRFCGSSSNERTVKLLIEHGADIEAKTEYGIRSLMIASRDCTTESSYGAMILLLENDAQVDAIDNFGNTALMLATANAGKDSSVKAMDILLKYGANPNLKNNMKTNALMIATKNCDNTSSLRALKFLLDKNTNVEDSDNDGWTPLMIASRYSKSGSSLSALRMLLTYGAKVNIKDIYGNTPLMYASKYSMSDSCIDTVKLLIENNANINDINSNGCTALMFSCGAFNTTSSFETILFLLNRGAYINISAFDGSRALTYFIRQRPSKIYLETFLNKYPDLNYKDKTGSTPLIIASINKDYDMVNSLLFRSPDITAKTNNGTDFFCFIYVDKNIKLIYESYLKTILKFGTDNLLQDRRLCEKILNTCYDYEDKTINNDLNILKLRYFEIATKKVSGECNMCFETKNILMGKCEHTYCNNCITKLKLCPVCNRDILGDKFREFV